MRVKTSNLKGVALDWAVIYVLTYEATGGKPILTGDLMRKAIQNGLANYSTDWALGGPIIDREEITIDYRDNETLARIWKKDNYIQSYAEKRQGLIAAMRCFVVSKLGDEVEIPDELE